MARRFPRALGARARKTLLREDGADLVTVMILLSPAQSIEGLEDWLETQGGHLRSWSGEALLATAEVPLQELIQLAEQPGVVSVDVANRMGP
ncbi:MAG: hypothetical protein R3195_17575 [Gemmatimonadota bacterium]|nr:hypothetical protein [Gemmatimonadota bacterium]